MRFSLYLAAALVALTNAIDLQSMSQSDDIITKVSGPDETNFMWKSNGRGGYYKATEPASTAKPLEEHPTHV